MIESKGRVLVIEDEDDIRELLRLNLQSYGYEVHTVSTGEEGLLFIKAQKVDLALVDWMLPGISGVQVAKTARAMESARDVAILMVTAKSEPENIVEGLEAGADDYVVKPFDKAVLLARVSALLRRVQKSKKDILNQASHLSEELVLGDIRLSLKTYEVKIQEQVINLTPSEFKLLAAMMSNLGRVMTRDRLIEEVQGEGVSVIGRTVDTHVFGLRKKLGVSGDLIETIRGVGYRIKDMEL